MIDGHRFSAGPKLTLPSTAVLEIDLVSDRVEPRLGALLILVAAGCAGNADAAEQAAASFDHQPTSQQGDMRQLRKAGLQLTGADGFRQFAGGGTKTHGRIG